MDTSNILKFLRENFFSNNCQTIWHIILIGILLFCTLVYNTWVSPLSKDYGLISRSFVVWDTFVLILTGILTFFYYLEIVGYSHWINNLGKEEKQKHFDVFTPGQIGFFVVFILISIVSIVKSYEFLNEHRYDIMILYLIVSTICYCIMDFVSIKFIKHNTKYEKKITKYLNKKINNQDKLLLSKKVYTLKQSLIFANLITLIGLSILLIYIYRYGYYFELSVFSEDAKKIVHDFKVSFVGGAASMHVVFGNMVVGFLMRD